MIGLPGIGDHDPRNARSRWPECAQIDALLKVADGFSAKGRFKDVNRKRLRAMILLLRYSGLRISDAAVLDRARLSGDKLFL